MLSSANLSFGLFPGLTRGAVEAIAHHASAELKSRYLPKMVSGEWSGAMDLTEASAGTDLGLLRTRAVPNGEGAAPELDLPGHLGELQLLHEQLRQRRQMPLAEVVDDTEVGASCATIVMKSSRSPQALAIRRASEPRAISIEQQRHHHVRVERRLIEHTLMAPSMQETGWRAIRRRWWTPWQRPRSRQ